MSSPASLTVLQITDASGSLQTLQCDLDDIDYGGAASITKEETFCAVNKTKGNPDNSINLSGFWNSVSGRSHAVFQGLKADTTNRLYKYGPAGSASGAVLLSGVSLLTEYRIKATAGGGVKVTAKFEIDGNDVNTTWP